MSGMVKSYNRKGFGFILCQAIEQDIYFSRESIHPNLQTSDLAGEQIQFEIHRFPDGKLQARNLRALGDVSDFKGSSVSANREYGAGARAHLFANRTNGLEEDRTRDWYCKACGERNFLKRSECYKCKTEKPPELQETPAPAAPVVAPAPKRHLSPHSGSRAVRELMKEQLAGRGSGIAASRSRSRAENRASSSSSTSSRKRRKQRKKKTKKGKRSSSSGSSSSSARSRNSPDKGGDDKKDTPAQDSNPVVENAKAEALEKLMKLKLVEPKDQRLKEWRLLLRQWHPDKNPENQEVATAVFQFLQKGKLLIDAG